MGYRQSNSNPFGSIMSLVIMAVVIIGLYYLATGIFTLLAWAAPVLLLITLVLDHKIILNFGSWLIKLIKTKPLNGVLAILFIFFAFPLVAGFLFTKALFKRQTKGMLGRFDEQKNTAQQDGSTFDSNVEDIEYEELDIDDAPEKQGRGYKDLFND